jgi:magnesium chelatase subunit I
MREISLPPDPPADLPVTLGALRASEWESVTVHQELRRNASAKIAAGEPVVSGLFGFEDTVLPQLENAVLAGHDVILLGERGQAKTRIVRSLVQLLDEWLPVVAGSEIRDDPYNPVSRPARSLVGELGDATPISWVHRSERFTEKLATPDTSIADLIGEVDPIKVAEGRYLADELTVHFGLVPRSNRGIFAINELPDLAERIQVGLLNVLEERDVQIRGFTVRLPLDVVLVATANPEDYTNRGRIITPLKDRFGAQIRTHYPLDTEMERQIVEAESQLPDPVEGGPTVLVPQYMAEIVAEISQLARQSPHLDQRSGVSVRLGIANYETLVASATRRALRLGEADAVPRVSDLPALVSSMQGKVEIEAMEEGREERIFQGIVSAAVLSVFRRLVKTGPLGPVVSAFDSGRVVHAGADVSSSEYAALLSDVPELGGPVAALGDLEVLGAVAGAIEFLLEGLHLSKRLNKDSAASGTVYRGRG